MWLHIALTMIDFSTQEMEERAMPTGAAIREMALTYAKEVNPGTHFKASRRWLEKFKKTNAYVEMMATTEDQIPTAAEDKLLQWISKVSV